MIRLVFFDLRDHAATWIGAFAVAVACGYIGGWAASIEATSSACEGLRSVGSVVIAFSLVAAVAVLSSASNLTVAAQRRSYALWQLANVGPRMVGAVVLAQLAVVAMAGALCGTLLASVSFAPLFPLVFGARGEYDQVVPQVGVALMPYVWLVVTGVFLAGGLKGARSASGTPPITALREPSPKRAGMTWLRALLFACLAGCVGWVVSIMAGSASDAVMNWSIYLPVLLTATIASVAPLILSIVLRVWTSIMPQGRWSAWYLARHFARHGLSVSTSVETPIMVGFGLVAGIYSVLNVWSDYAARQGAANFNGLDWTTALLMLGGPVLLCAVGAAVGVVMSSKSRARDVALLVASGARPRTLVAAAVCEALIHAVTATLAGVCVVAASNAVVARSVGLPLFGGLAFGEGLVVSLAGFVLVLAATLVPTCAALRKEAAGILAAQE